MKSVAGTSHRGVLCEVSRDDSITLGGKMPKPVWLRGMGLLFGLRRKIAFLVGLM